MNLKIGDTVILKHAIYKDPVRIFDSLALGGIYILSTIDDMPYNMFRENGYTENCIDWDKTKAINSPLYKALTKDVE